MSQNEIPIFETQNASLAFTLIQAGAQMDDPPNDIRNEYTVEILQSAGLINPGVTLKEACETAVKKGIKGHLHYAFKRNENLEKMLKVYDETMKRLKEMDAEKKGGPQPTGFDVEISQLDAVRFICATLKNRKGFLDGWKDITPWITIAKPGQLKSKKLDDGKKFLITSPGFMSFPITAPDHILKHMGVI